MSMSDQRSRIESHHAGHPRTRTTLGRSLNRPSVEDLRSSSPLLGDRVVGALRGVLVDELHTAHICHDLSERSLSNACEQQGAWRIRPLSAGSMAHAHVANSCTSTMDIQW